MRLTWHDTDSVRLYTNELCNLISESDKVMDGKVDATIHGRYFGEKLEKDQFVSLQRLALSVIAAKMYEAIDHLGRYDVTVDDDYGSPIRSRDGVEALLNRRLDAVLEASLNQPA